MRILLVLYEHDRDVRGGMGGFRHAVELAEAWRRAGHPTTILRPRRGGTEEPTPVPVVETPMVEGAIVRPMSAYGGLLLGGLRAARRSRPEVIYAREMLGPVPLVLARLLGIPLVLEVNADSYTHRRRVLRQSSLQLAVVRGLQRFNFRRADRIVTVTPGLRTALIDRFALDPARLAVVGNGANLARLAPMDAAQARRALGLPDGAYVGFVGTFFHHQGVATLIAAASRMLAARPATRFLVVGAGPAREAWEAAVRAAGLAAAFSFPGQVPHAVVGTWINAMDVCTAPFTADRGEASPLKLFDYLACARPVVVSDIPAVRDFIAASGGCVPVPPDDPDALATAIIALLDDDARRRRLGDTGRAWVAAEHGWDMVARRVLDVCAAALTARADRGRRGPSDHRAGPAGDRTPRPA